MASCRRPGAVVRWRAPAGMRMRPRPRRAAVPVPPFYDSMLAKPIAHAPTREGRARPARGRAGRTVCWGVTTNRAFLARVLRTRRSWPATSTRDFSRSDDVRAMADAVGRAGLARGVAAASLALLPRMPIAAALAALVVFAGDRHDRADRSRAGTTRRWQLTGTRAAFDARCGDATHRIERLARCRGGAARSTSTRASMAARSRVSAPSTATSAGGKPKGTSSPRSTCACAAPSELARRRRACCSRRCTAA